MRKAAGKGEFMDGMTRKALYDAETVCKRVAELGREISEKHSGGNLLLIGVLKGCFMFMADLVRAITVPTQIDFVRISSYGSGTSTSGALEILMDIKTPIKGRNVILVDDIVDSGLTLHEYRKRLEKLEPASLETVALIDKVGKRDKHVSLDYCGFRIEEGFVVGYGLDCNEQYRELAALYVLE
jgi:hypoxanthine phosphoribosyltransferase